MVRHRSGHGFVAPRSNAVVRSGEEGEIVQNRATAKEARIREALAELKLLEAEEQIAERRERLDDTKAHQQAQVAARRKHLEWKGVWLQYTLDQIPDDAKDEYSPILYKAVESELGKFSPDDPEFIVKSAVDRTVQRVLASYFEHEELLENARGARSTAMEMLPEEMKPDLPSRVGAAFSAMYGGSGVCLTEWQVRADEAATAALNHIIREGHGKRLQFESLLEVAKAAVAGVIDEYNAEQAAKVHAARIEEVKRRVLR
jgi:hypothetical protein